MQNIKKLSKNFSKLLDQQNLSTKELSTLIDVPQSTLTRLINGTIKNPNQTVLIKIAQFFGVAVTELTGELNADMTSSQAQEYLSDDDFMQMSVQEVMLELIQDDEGRLVLRESKNHDEVLVCIDFSEKVKSLLAGDVRIIGEHMIQAALASVMQQQINRYHAHIHDEEPERYS
ncbi:helix-turn-helix transcriptional regulator [Moraxella nasovis]|uniref:helix-turn-helix domain-containing protein n=1 Tax=Moraxella nasovis TaxID=2904121 RepID=UPI001F602DBE|nr:helix-turn-helix transcriptional regulator [Moraxella nasovis]UNU73155.1 helix-turn-helix transcriptional regulator [Moraxella nasovis]